MTSLIAPEATAVNLAVQLTLPLLRDTNSVIRSRALAVVQEITVENVSDSDPAKWEAWWASKQRSFTPRGSAP